MEVPESLDALLDRSTHKILKCNVTMVSHSVLTNLIIYQSPLFEESVDTHDGTHIASQVSSTGSHGKVLSRSEPVCIDHEVTIVLVNGRRLGPVARVKKLRESTAFDGVCFRHVEPCRV